MQVTLREILKPVIPKLIDFLMTLARAQTKVALAESLTPDDRQPEAAVFDANTLYRYSKKKVVPMRNLPMLGSGVGLSPRNMAWLLGHFLTEHYMSSRVDLGARPGEIREPEPRYDERSLESALETVMSLDLQVLEAEQIYAFNRERNALRAACEQLQADLEDAQKRADRRAGPLLELLGLFRERAEKALHRAKSTG